MRKEIKEKKRATNTEDAKKEPIRANQIFIFIVILLALGFLWMMGKGVIYIFNIASSRL